ncbi:MAG: hypothetical protein ACFFDT_00985 [Candidatus Hodarchaeota archaeon]
MSFRKVVLFLFVVVTINNTIPALGYSSVTLQSINSKNTLLLTITDAIYTDLDNDDVLDIISSFDLSLDSTRRHTTRIDVFLILPSGCTFYYKWIIGTKDQTKSYQIIFLDHAIESGMYKLIFLIRPFTGGASIGVMENEFDPPGGSGGGDPIAIFC